MIQHPYATAYAIIGGVNFLCGMVIGTKLEEANKVVHTETINPTKAQIICLAAFLIGAVTTAYFRQGMTRVPDRAWSALAQISGLAAGCVSGLLAKQYFFPAKT